MTGYYSIIQYCPDLSRQEAVNVGVILFCPEVPFLDVKTSENVKRIRKVFGADNGDANQIRMAIAALEGRLKAEREQLTDADALAKFGARQANSVQITVPRRVLVEKPGAELSRLYERLVSPRKARPAADVKTVLEAEFSTRIYQTLLRRKVDVVVPEFRRVVTIPYAYQNGRFNLIQPAKFNEDSSTDIIQTAGRFALQGELLYRTPNERLGPVQLVVVGQFPKGRHELADSVRRVFAERQTILYRLEEAKQLFEEIKSHAKPLTTLPDELGLLAGSIEE